MPDEYTQKSTFIIAVKTSSELERIAQNSKHHRLSEEELLAMQKEKQKLMKPIDDYLNNLGLKKGRDYKILADLLTVNALLTSEQAENLKRESYIEDICGDFGLEHID